MSRKEKKKITGGQESDDRLAELRSELFLLVRSRQQELVKDVSCDLCKQPLVGPTRLLQCRHVLCKSCALKSVQVRGGGRRVVASVQGPGRGVSCD